MTRGRLLVAVAAATVVIAVVVVSHASNSRARHAAVHRRVDRSTIVATATRFVTAATEPAYRLTSWSTLAVPALAGDLALRRGYACRAAADVIDVSVTSNAPTLVFVTAQCQDPVDGQTIALAWTLRLVDTTAGWRVAGVTS